MAGEADAILLTLLAFLFPPAAVAFVSGCGIDLCVNILLTMLAYLPGCIHAFWIVYRRSEANERYGYGNWTYKGMGEYLPLDASQQQQQQQPQQQQQQQQKGGGQQTYVQPQGPVPPPPPPPPPGPPSGSGPAPGAQQYAEKSPAYAQPLPPPAPVEQKHEYQAPPQIDTSGGEDQKQAGGGGGGGA